MLSEFNSGCSRSRVKRSKRVLSLWMNDDGFQSPVNMKIRFQW